jgi:hypothetical protein
MNHNKVYHLLTGLGEWLTTTIGIVAVTLVTGALGLACWMLYLVISNGYVGLFS